MQHRRLRLRSASQGFAPAPGAGRHSTATKENQEHRTRVRTGNSVSPLDKTYHGGVAVGTIVAGRPPHRSVRALLRIRLPPWMTGVKALHRIRMENARCWN